MIKHYSRTLLTTVLLLTAVAYPFSFYTPVLANTATQNALRSSIMQGIQSDINASNNTTNIINSGDNTDIDTNANSSSQTTVHNQNTAQVNQQIDAHANTGNNEASRNISIGGNAGIIMTGNAAVNTQQIVNANDNVTAISGGGTYGSNNTDIVNTGDGVDASTSSQSKRSTLVNNDNTLVVNQTANTSANTGNNRADRNISIGGVSGAILTGNASTNSSFLLAGNGSVALVGGVENGNGPGTGASIILTNTGDRGRFGSHSTHASALTVNNTNNAQVSQSCGSLFGCSAITGGNSSDRGIAQGGNAGVIQTSNAVVNVVLYAQANTNRTAVSGTGKGTSSQNNTNVMNTGDDVSIQTGSNDSNTTHVNNTNNAFIDQAINAVADTGNNHANRNISIGGDAGLIRTGNAVINAITVADVNGNGTEIGIPTGN
ncbi:MAG: hypothetical protein RI947_410 [Candidatus Parcubacteria bacterium]|jgi:hypothetical protein